MTTEQLLSLQKTKSKTTLRYVPPDTRLTVKTVGRVEAQSKGGTTAKAETLQKLGLLDSTVHCADLTVYITNSQFSQLEQYERQTVFRSTH